MNSKFQIVGFIQQKMWLGEWGEIIEHDKGHVLKQESEPSTHSAYNFKSILPISLSTRSYVNSPTCHDKNQQELLKNLKNQPSMLNVLLHAEQQNMFKNQKKSFQTLRPHIFKSSVFENKLDWCGVEPQRWF